MGIVLSELVADYKASLQDAASVFTAAADADFIRHLRTAASVLARTKRTRTLTATLTLVADQAEYTDVPEDLIAPKVSAWGSTNVAVWDQPPGPLPSLYLGESAGVPVLRLLPPPTAAQIRCLGASYVYYYLAEHTLSEVAADSTIQARDRDLIILRAQAEAMREMAFRNIHKPMTLRTAGAGSAPRTDAPSALYRALLDEYEAAR